ncbi:spinocerebellar ataxia type 10 protein domain-containing protein [Ephemerocybe angulata]|uniref:Ataxin-10 homolog n=1 Tax=Ephemerocybe angulata TaxID=980116 RepID=A0A8H6I9T5_9AGAR|nr:spinocerebellar ataxia type 10 protein domain-containing protein [Tulosesus angulatus]
MADSSGSSTNGLGSLPARVRKASSGFSILETEKVKVLAETLESGVLELQNEGARKLAGTEQTLWTDLRKLKTEPDVTLSEESRYVRSLCMALAKFTRNLVAGVPENQVRAYENEPEIRRLIHYYTSWSAMEDPESIATARVLTQALSNIVTSNQNLVAALWETYLGLPEDQVVLIRLLASPDVRTLLTTLIFILNCIHGSRRRTKLLAKSTIGARICVALLDDMLRLFEEEEESEGGKAFNVGYAIFTRLIEEGTVPDLYKKFTMPDEIITPHQTTLLKLVDSYLQSIQLDISTTAEVDVLQTHVALGPFLAKRFFTLSNYAQAAMQRAIGSSIPPSSPPKTTQPGGAFSNGEASTSSGSHEPPAELDVMLPKVCEALVLATQCVTTVALEAEEHHAKLLQFHAGGGEDIPNMKDFFIDVRYSSQGLVENLIETLRLLDLFLPRIYFGKPVPSPAAPNQQLPNVDPTGFLYVKRDLVRLLGVLAHECRAVQDRTRKAGGIPVVMNLCVIDERNPFLREHALFTLHNLLKNNKDNQAAVDAIKPEAEFDEAGVLKDKFSAMKVK